MKQKIHRVSAKAIVIENEKVLLIKKNEGDGDYYLFPGGGQNHGESLHQTLLREVKEETGYTVSPGDLVYARDYIGANHEFSDKSAHFHQVELYFDARLKNAERGAAHEIDTNQIGMEWVPVPLIHQFNIYPVSIKAFLADRSGKPIYAGDVN